MTKRVDDILGTLEHHGVKGMKWGVRKDRGHEGERAKTKVINKADKAYTQQFEGVRGYIKVNNAIAGKINPKLDVLNAKPQYQGNLLDNPSTHKKYINEYQGLLKDSLDEVMTDFGVNASGTRRLKLSVVGEGLETSWQADWEDLQQDAVSTGFRIVPYFDKNGKITGQTIKPLDAEHAEALGDFLEHYGVKGMKWGVRKDRPTSADVAGVKEAKSKVRRGDTSALSNKELQSVVTRMNLDQQYSRLTAKPSVLKKGSKIVASVLALGATANSIIAFANSPAGKALSAAIGAPKVGAR